MKAPRSRGRELTTPDLVLLSLLAERPMHGYQANAELERREVRDWAGISRAQPRGRERCARGGARSASVRDVGEGPRGASGCVGTRALGDAAGASALPDVGCAFVAGAAGRFPEATEAPAAISGERGGAGRGNASVHRGKIG